MTTKELLTQSHKLLLKTSPTPHLDNEVLLSHVLGKTREWILAHPEEKIANANEQKFLELIDKRLTGEPVAYLVGHKEFFGLNFLVDKRVPIPRPETEALVEETIAFLTSCNLASACSVTGGEHTPIIDIGTGSGCIAIALAKNLPHVQIIATDISKNALDVAKKNARKHGVDKQIVFLQKDLFGDHIHESANAYSRLHEYDNAPILIANLPYLPKAIYQTADKSVRIEPAQAHLGGEKGYEIIEKFLKQARAVEYNCHGQAQKLKPQAIFFEFHYEYKNELGGLIKKYFPDYKFEFKKDLAGKERVVCIID